MNAVALALALCGEPDLPSLDDLARFPGQETTRQMLRFYSDRRQWLNNEALWQSLFRS
jgi:hypothetical protein